MIPNTARRAVAYAALAALLSIAPARAQFGTPFPGFVRLPAEDFTWIWGDAGEEEMNRRSPDFKASGFESGFSCELTGRLRPGRAGDRSELRSFERDLANSMVFIQAAAQSMTSLDRNLDLDWAMLDCDKRSDEPLSEEAAQERTDRALEKAIRERERRRARAREGG